MLYVMRSKIIIGAALLVVIGSGIAGFLLFKKYTEPLSRLAGIASSATSLDMTPSSTSPFFTSRSNILLLGVAGQGNAAPNLTDTIMLLSLNPEKKTFALTSFPRDLLVASPQDPKTTVRINSLWEMGLANHPEDPAYYLRNTIENISGINAPYFATINLDGVGKIVDLVGGINLMVPERIYDPEFPAPGFGITTFSINPGWQHMNGDTAVKYIRTRHTLASDFGRMRRQQAVLNAILAKVRGMNALTDFSKLWSLYETVKQNISTNLTRDDLEQLYALSPSFNLDNGWRIVLDSGDQGFLENATVYFGDQQAYVLKPKQGDFSQIQNLEKNIFNQTLNP